MIGEELDDTAVERCDRLSYKKFIKAKIKTAALKYLNEKKNTHSKVSSLNYDELKIQEYLTSPIFSDEDINVLFALRSRYVECRDNFKNRYREDNLQCLICMQSSDTQRHMMECEVINKHIEYKIIEDDKAEYEDIFAESDRQRKETRI